jgi:hypothetical protein
MQIFAQDVFSPKPRGSKKQAVESFAQRQKILQSRCRGQNPCFTDCQPMESCSTVKRMEDLLGLHQPPQELGFMQIVLRAVIVFFAALIMVRTSAKRLLGRKTAFDFILAIMLGSTLSRAINGSASLFPTLIAGFALVLVHRFLAALAFRFHLVGDLIKGREEIVVQMGSLAKMPCAGITSVTAI